MKKMLNENGFTFLAALMIVVIMGLMLSLTSQSLKTVMKREREQELLFRGLQYRDAIGAWNTRPAKPGATTKVIPLNDLKDLLLDPTSLQKSKYLRKLYKDPMTGKDWAIIRDNSGRGIVGVASTSADAPLKTSFSEYSGLDSFAGKKSYREWRFVFGLDPGTSPASFPQ